jgi:hypothetical protein
MLQMWPLIDQFCQALYPLLQPITIILILSLELFFNFILLFHQLNIDLVTYVCHNTWIADNF